MSRIDCNHPSGARHAHIRVVVITHKNIQPCFSLLKLFLRFGCHCSAESTTGASYFVVRLVSPQFQVCFLS